MCGIDWVEADGFQARTEAGNSARGEDRCRCGLRLANVLVVAGVHRMRNGAILLGLVLGVSSGLTDVLPVGFERLGYVAGLGEIIPVRVELKSTLPVGLFSYGLRLVYAPELGGVVDVTAISAPAELDFDGVAGPGARKEVGAGFGAIKGTVDFFADPARFYSGTLLATFNVSCNRLGDYLLALELYRTLGPTESVFVSGEGVSLDELLEWGTATLTVIPEPRTVVFLMLGIGCVWLLRFR